MKITMNFVKATKNTFVYEENIPAETLELNPTAAIIPRLYIRKHALPDTPPKVITLEVTT